MVIHLESIIAEQNKELKEYDMELNTEYKETYICLLRTKKNNKN